MPTRKTRHPQQGKKKLLMSQMPLRDASLPVPVAPERVLMSSLPVELQLAILGNLENEDLKQVRLVFKNWSLLVIPLLFDKVYISPRRLDLEVFRLCAAHPHISKAVREVIYDTTHFDPALSLSRYCGLVTRDIPRHFHVKPFEHPSHSYHNFTNEWVSEIGNTQIRNTAQVLERHKNDAFIVEGYRNWQHHALYEQAVIEDGRLFDMLCFGLSRFANLRSVVITGGLFGTNVNETESMNRSTLRCKYSGSPVTRSWNPLHARPYDCKPEHISSHLENITSALVETDRRIRSLILMSCDNDFDGLPLTTLQKATTDSTLLADSLEACSGLETFELRVSTGNDDKYSDAAALGLLPTLLGQMNCLKHLKLSLFRSLRRDNPDCHDLYTFEQVFPKLVVWPHLVSLDIAALSVKATEFMVFLSYQLPKLRRLSLFNINLLNGAWEGMIEVFHSLGLSDLSIGDASYLSHNGDYLFSRHGTPDTGSTSYSFTEDIEDYAVYGGRHPCLPPGCPPEAAEGYYWRLISDDELETYQTMFKRNGITPRPDPGSIVPSMSRS